jgi:ketosteroid isomerase-like protein
MLLVSISIFSSACHRTRQARTFSHSNDMNQIIETLRGAYAAFNRGDMDAAVAPMDPSIEWVEPLEFPGGGARQGRDAVKQYLTQSRAGWAEGSSEPEGFVISNDKIVVFVHARFRLKNADAWQEVKLADVYTVSDKKIMAMHAFADRKEALRWAGATEQQYKEAS